MGYRLRLIEDVVNVLLHREGYHLMIYRHDAEDLVTFSLSRVVLDHEYEGDQCPAVKSRVGRKTVSEEDLHGG